jgi:hypothetical protein
MELFNGESQARSMPRKNKQRLRQEQSMQQVTERTSLRITTRRNSPKGYFHSPIPEQPVSEDETGTNSNNKNYYIRKKDE